MHAFVSAYADCFRRELDVGHVTGSAWVLSRDRRRVLLTHHRKLDLWLQLGGHADGESDVRLVALREAQEESGLRSVRLAAEAVFDVDVHPIPVRATEPEHFHYDVRFLFEADDSESLTVSGESYDLAWIELERVAELSGDRSVARMVRKSFALRA
jgi:8-oxo-dGTP pyrophosphatase MutT (NUDIX family)